MDEFDIYDLFTKNPEYVKSLNNKRRKQENKTYIVLATFFTIFFIVILVLYLVYKNKRNKFARKNNLSKSDAFLYNNLGNNNNKTLSTASNIDLIIKTAVQNNKDDLFNAKQRLPITENNTSDVDINKINLESNLKNKISDMLKKEYTDMSDENIKEVSEWYINEKNYLPEQWKNLKELETNLNGSNNISNNSADTDTTNNDILFLLERRLNYLDDE